jgi:polysaccharide deacetylase family protein (PEP-CTERM system associated)
MEKHILTIDVEDNFTYEELVDKNDWVKYEGQVVNNTIKILSILKKFSATATFFVVGIVAERHPELIKFIYEDGHEISCHSYWHKPLNTLKWSEIEEDVKKSKEIITSIIGVQPLGYRAMGFSIPKNQIKYFEILKKYGFIYDSSNKYDPDGLKKTFVGHSIISAYPSFIKLAKKRVIFSGGTYFRLLPFNLIKKGFREYSEINEPVMLYIHSWEFNRDQPKRNVPIKKRILQSPITFSTEKKLLGLSNNYKFVSIKQYIENKELKR